MIGRLEIFGGPIFTVSDTKKNGVENGAPFLNVPQEFQKQVFSIRYLPLGDLKINWFAQTSEFKLQLNLVLRTKKCDFGPTLVDFSRHWKSLGDFLNDYFLI